jgi:cyclase
MCSLSLTVLLEDRYATLLLQSLSSQLIQVACRHVLGPSNPCAYSANFGASVNKPAALTACLSFLLVLGLASVAVAADPADNSVAVQKVQIAADIYQFITAPDGYVPNGNSVVIVNDDDVLVFDTFARPSTARAVLAEIRKITSKPVRYVVNSHHHPDHWSGNQVYAREFPKLEIISSEESRKFMLNIANAWPSMWEKNLRADQANLEKEIAGAKDADGAPLTAEQRRKDEDDVRLERAFVEESANVQRTYPTLTYSDKLTLHHGGREFRFMSMVGDATGTTVLYLPNEKILITGDVISYPVPYFTPPLSQHAKTLRTLSRLDAEIIIPGHGPAWHDKSFLNLEAELFESIVSQVSLAVQKGLVTVEEIQNTVNVELLRPKFTHDDKALNAKFQRYVNRMIENASREARDSRKFE